MSSYAMPRGHGTDRALFGCGPGATPVWPSEVLVRLSSYTHAFTDDCPLKRWFEPLRYSYGKPFVFWEKIFSPGFTEHSTSIQETLDI